MTKLDKVGKFAEAGRGEDSRGALPRMAGAAFERDEMVKLLKASSIPEAAIDDFERCHVGTITRFSSYAVGKLVTEPPTAATLIALMLGLRTGSTLAGADAWADPTADAAGYALLTSNMTTLCRFVALQKEKAARRELTYVGAAGALDDAALRSREEEEKKNHKAKAAELAMTASAMYNTDFLELCDSAVLVATYHEFQRNRLVTARLHSGKYGRPSVHLAERSRWVAADDHTIKEESAEVGGATSLTRNGHILVQIFNATESLVIAGTSEINKTLAHYAGAHGIVNRTSKAPRQVNFDLTTKLQVDKAFTMLSGSLTPKALEALFDDQFIPTVGTMMASGHSCASAAMSILANSAWMRVAGAGSEKAAAGGVAGASTEVTAATPAKSMKADKAGLVRNAAGEVEFITATKYTQMRTAHEKQVKEMKAARERDRRGGGGPRQETSYRGVHYPQYHDSRYDEPQYEVRRDRDRSHK